MTDFEKKFYETASQDLGIAPSELTDTSLIEDLAGANMLTLVSMGVDMEETFGTGDIFEGIDADQIRTIGGLKQLVKRALGEEVTLSPEVQASMIRLDTGVRVTNVTVERFTVGGFRDQVEALVKQADKLDENFAQTFMTALVAGLNINDDVSWHKAVTAQQLGDDVELNHDVSIDSLTTVAIMMELEKAFDLPENHFEDNGLRF